MKNRRDSKYQVKVKKQGSDWYKKYRRPKTTNSPENFGKECQDIKNIIFFDQDFAFRFTTNATRAVVTIPIRGANRVL